MAALAEYFQNWKEHNGKVVVIEGIKCRIKVCEYLAIYPYQHKAIMVHANAIDGDLYFDLLGSTDYEFNIACNVLAQV